MLLEKRKQAGFEAKRKRELLARAMDGVRKTKAWHQAENLLDRILSDVSGTKLDGKSKSKGFDVRGVLMDEEQQEEAGKAVLQRIQSGKCPSIGVAAAVAKERDEGKRNRSSDATPYISPIT